MEPTLTRSEIGLINHIIKPIRADASCRQQNVCDSVSNIQFPNASSLWLVTGAAGFIGSNLVEALLLAGQRVRALDNFATGFQHNVTNVIETVGATFAQNFEFVEGDIRDRKLCKEAVNGVNYILHQAGLGSVPRSLADPVTTNDVNVSGFLNMLNAAREEGASRFVYAASSSTYGDEPNLPKIESRIGNPLSPYAVSKLVNEIYAANFKHSYGYRATGLRYFNVFGPRQDPNGAYAAVIPKWISSMIHGENITINGDGSTSRDFCYVANAVQANIRAALAPTEVQGEVFNVAVGHRTSLKELFDMLRDELRVSQVHYDKVPVFVDFRKGDVKHSLADISKAAAMLGYVPDVTVRQGLRTAVPWYIAQHSAGK
jgi:UDP-N-acetylglucosamine/UDP-N-acetylgalactosamine 4-epimerase